jgi:hypothetical protein
MKKIYIKFILLSTLATTVHATDMPVVDDEQPGAESAVSPSIALQDLFTPEEIDNISIAKGIIQDRLCEKQKLLESLQDENTLLPKRILDFQNLHFASPVSSGFDFDNLHKNYCSYIKRVINYYKNLYDYTDSLLCALNISEKFNALNNIFYFCHLRCDDADHRRQSSHVTPEMRDDIFFKMISDLMPKGASEEYVRFGKYLEWGFVGSSWGGTLNEKTLGPDVVDMSSREWLEWIKCANSHPIVSLSRDYESIKFQVSKTKMIKEMGEQNQDIFFQLFEEEKKQSGDDKDHLIYMQVGKAFYKAQQPLEVNTQKAVKELKALIDAADTYIKKYKKTDDFRLWTQKQDFHEKQQWYAQAKAKAQKVELDRQHEIKAKQHAEEAARAQEKKEAKRQAKAAKQAKVPEHTRAPPLTVEVTPESNSTAPLLFPIQPERPAMPREFSAPAAVARTEAQRSADGDYHKKHYSSSTSHSLYADGNPIQKEKRKTRPQNLTPEPSDAGTDSAQNDSDQDSTSFQNTTVQYPSYFYSADFQALIGDLLTASKERTLRQDFSLLNRRYEINAVHTEHNNKGSFSIKSPITKERFTTTYHNLHNPENRYASIFLSLKKVLEDTGLTACLDLK